jgi:hypothetical protein
VKLKTYSHGVLMCYCCYQADIIGKFIFVILVVIVLSYDFIMLFASLLRECFPHKQAVPWKCLISIARLCITLKQYYNFLCLYKIILPRQTLDIRQPVHDHDCYSAPMIGPHLVLCIKRFSFLFSRLSSTLWSQILQQIRSWDFLLQVNSDLKV